MLEKYENKKGSNQLQLSVKSGGFFSFEFILKIFYIQICTLQHINNSYTKEEIGSEQKLIAYIAPLL